MKIEHFMTVSSPEATAESPYFRSFCNLRIGYCVAFPFFLDVSNLTSNRGHIEKVS